MESVNTKKKGYNITQFSVITSKLFKCKRSVDNSIDFYFLILLWNKLEWNKLNLETQNSSYLVFRNYLIK